MVKAFPSGNNKKKYGRTRSESMSHEGLHLLTEIIELPWTSKHVVFKRNTLRGLSIMLCINAWRISIQLHKWMQHMERLQRAKDPWQNTHAYAEDEEWQTWGGVSGRALKPAPRHSNRDWTSTAPEQALGLHWSRTCCRQWGGGWFIGSTLADREGQKLSHSPKSLGCCLYNTAVIHLIKSRKNIRLKSVQRIIV